MFSFQDTHLCQMVQAIKWSNHGRLIVTTGVQSGQFEAESSAPHGILSNTPQHVGIDRCHTCLKASREIFMSPERDCMNILL
jgi:hypothetical protein